MNNSRLILIISSTLKSGDSKKNHCWNISMMLNEISWSYYDFPSNVSTSFERNHKVKFILFFALRSLKFQKAEGNFKTWMILFCGFTFSFPHRLMDFKITFLTNNKKGRFFVKSCPRIKKKIFQKYYAESARRDKNNCKVYSTIHMRNKDEKILKRSTIKRYILMSHRTDESLIAWSKKLLKFFFLSITMR